MKNIINYYSHARPEMLEFVPEDSKTILDIGCGEGYFGLALKNLGKEVWGVERHQKSFLAAAGKLDKVIFGDIFSVLPSLPNNYFDCLVFNDVLEHLADPYSLLEMIKSKLSENGVVVCSIPNVRHVKVLRDLIFKKEWEYTDVGILDRTHLRFFTKKSLVRMLNDSDYEILKIQGINATSFWKFFPINLLTFGFFSDSRYLQFACLVKPRINE